MDDVRAAEDASHAADLKIQARNVQVYYGQNHALKDVDVDIADKTVTAFIGPSGCGKSTFQRCINRMNDTIDIARIKGEILLDVEGLGHAVEQVEQVAEQPLLNLNPVLLNPNRARLFSKHIDQGFSGVVLGFDEQLFADVIERSTQGGGEKLTCNENTWHTHAINNSHSNPFPVK